MRDRPYCVGLTGGIGSGKSRVADLFAARGVTVIDTDLISRGLTAPNGAAIEAIRAVFGPAFITQAGGLDRNLMRSRVFASPEDKARLESLLHPAIREAAATQLLAAPGKYALLVVPLLVETGAYGPLVDRVLVVDCPVELQIERVMRRDRLSRAQVEAILAAQASRADRLLHADDVIDNQGDPDHLVAKVAALDRAYREQAGRRGANGIA
ncbi:MAG: dephospho-CoA kinase [Pseudomonadota bacterium]